MEDGLRARRRGLGAAAAVVLAAGIVALAVYLGAWKPLRGWLWPDPCGWIARGDVRLERDLVGCGERGLRIAPFAVLDCAGHEIRGRGVEESGEGVRLNGVSYAEVRNCRISGFARGVRIRGGRDNRVIANRIEGNGTGIDVAGRTDAGPSQGLLLEGNQIRGSTKDALHLSGGVRVTIRDNVVERSGGEGLSLEACEGCRVTGNTVAESGEAAIDLLGSSRGVYEDNVVRGALVKVRGDSAENVFRDNQLLDSGFVFAADVPRAEKGESGPALVPHDNRVAGGRVVGRRVCFRFTGARDNRIESVEVDSCRQAMEERPAGSIAAQGNTYVEAAAPSPNR